MNDLLLTNLRTLGRTHDDATVAYEAADEIERLRAERDTCGTGANCCYKEAMMESQAEKILVLREALTGLLDLFHEGQVTARDEASGYVHAAVSAGERVLEQTK